MSVQRTESAPRGGARKRTTRTSQPEPSLASQVADIMRFIQGQEHQADVGIQMEHIISGIRLVMDDDLISALETLEEHYVYDQHHASIHEVPQVYPVRDLLNQLRVLQKTRLRDALNRLTLQPN